MSLEIFVWDVGWKEYYRQDIYELPPDSIRELIVNAVMNCSYIQNSNIQVAIYDDRLEITSPGGLLPGVTIELMKEDFQKSEIVRLPMLLPI